jgi:hypothetical protein
MLNWEQLGEQLIVGAGFSLHGRARLDNYPLDDARMMRSLQRRERKRAAAKRFNPLVSRGCEEAATKSLMEEGIIL